MHACAHFPKQIDNIGFNECFDDTERIRAVYSLRNLKF